MDSNLLTLKFLGGTQTVTGSKTLLTVSSKNYLIDCGLFQGLKDLRLKNREPLPIDPAQIQAVILTHAHIDHSGYLPLLVKNGFNGRIYCTPSTLKLCSLLLPDSGYLQEEEARLANLHGYSKHKEALPLYTRDEALKCLSQFEPVDFGSKISLSKDVGFEFLYAGHILGASHIKIRAHQKTILFSGDLGRPEDPLLRAPQKIAQADYLIIESTYGNRNHDSTSPEEVLAAIVHRTLKRQGMIVIPAFAVGRAQMLLYYFYRLIKAGKIPDLPIYLNSPMAIHASKIYEEAYEDLKLSSEEIKNIFKKVLWVNTREDSEKLNHLQTPAVIISASGMATGGRVLHHLKAYLPDAKNTILLTGFQAAGTRGESLANGAREIKIHGTYVPVRAEIAQIHNLSAHADKNEILEWLSYFKSVPLKTYVNHGEPAAADALRRYIFDRFSWPVEVPHYLESFTLR